MQDIDSDFHYLNYLLRYSPVLGELRWNDTGEIAHDRLNGNGYPIVTVDDREFLVHRVAWLLQTGKWPNEIIDHRDRNRVNYKWGNLREATSSQNAANRTVRSDSATGVKGVWFDKTIGMYRAYIKIDGKRFNLGCYETPEGASAAYLARAKEVYGEYATDGR